MTTVTQEPVQEPAPIDTGAASNGNELARFVVIPEVQNPSEYTRGVKSLITAIVGLACAAPPMGSAVLFPALNLISKDFNASDSITNLNVALYMGSMAVFPMYWSRFSEVHGRRTVYLTSFTAFTLFNLAAALVLNPHYGLGGSAGAVQAVGAGTIADIWEVRERGQAMGWRGTMWFIFFFGVVLWILLVTALPETLRRKTQVNHINEKKDENLVDNDLRDVEENQTQPEPRSKICRFWSSVWYAVFDPITALKYIRFPPVALTINLTFMYILNVSLQSTFSRPPYNWPTAIVGLAYILPSIGNFAGSIIMKRGARRRQIKGKGNGNLIPEDRMGENAVLGGLLSPMGLMLYGWTVIRVDAWIVPLLGTFFFGFRSMLIFGMCTTMLTEFVPGKSSSATAVQNFSEIFSHASVVHALGEGVLFSIVGGISLLSISTI
ncbi:MFS general substrate transporter [Terfezia boudieri ATCC MYA-4762]|uniref:MFS general substrate transporter n=1 Tax=Terfezia boudieri ATCC MYA-4762 TaxID=1051890 RepID=A0A3N4LWN7_9PEZI|nr:MFS general substrate transporter [Terfezia boudieri ATCC MYA-4762]